MEDIFNKFPNLGEKILRQLDNKKLVTCKKVGRRWRIFLDQQKIVSIRLIEKHIGKSKKFSDDWKKVISKTPTHMVRRLALTVEEFCQNEKFKKKYCPLFIATNQNNLLLAWHIIK